MNFCSPHSLPEASPALPPRTRSPLRPKRAGGGRGYARREIFRVTRLAVASLVPLLALLWAPGNARAVTFSEQAERLQLIYAFLLDFRPGQAPLTPPRNELEIGLDLTAVPSINNRIGAKTEPVEPPAVIPRPRLRYLSSGGLMAGATYVPGLEFSGYQADLAGGEVGFRSSLGGTLWGVRAFALSGTIRGAITSPTVEDDFEVNLTGADLLLGWEFGAWLPYLGGGRGKAETTLFVISDGVVLKTAGDYSYLLAGVTLALDGFRITIEQSRSEDFLDHVTLGISVVFE